MVDSVQMDFRIDRCFIGRVETGEILDLSGLGLGVKALRVAPHAFVDRRVNEDLDEFALRHQAPHHLALGVIGRDERANDDQTGLGQQLRYFAGAADILDPVGLGEAEVAVEAVTDVVAVQ